MYVAGSPLPTLLASLSGKTNVLNGCGVSRASSQAACAVSVTPNAPAGGAGGLTPPLVSWAALIRASTMSFGSLLNGVSPFSSIAAATLCQHQPPCQAP